MIAWLKEYVLSVLTVSVVSLALEAIIPDGRIKRYFAFGMALILSVCLISPILKLNPEFKIDNYSIEAEYDLSDAVTRSVRSVSGFEDAQVTIVQDKMRIRQITVLCGDKKLLEEINDAVGTGFLKNMLSAVYGVEKENIRII